MTREQERTDAIYQLLALPDEPCLAGQRVTEPITMPSEPIDYADLKRELAQRWLQHRLQDAKDESSAKLRRRARLTLNRRRA